MSFSINFTNFCNICKEATSSVDVYKNFKRNPMYVDVLEHVSYDQAIEYAKIIKVENESLIEPSIFEEFKENDKIGNPIVNDFGFLGLCSPTIFRYVKILSDLKIHFGNLSGMNIIEIGAGNAG